jgi:hypothetical protein
MNVCLQLGDSLRNGPQAARGQPLHSGGRVLNPVTVAGFCRNSLGDNYFTPVIESPTSFRVNAKVRNEVPDVGRNVRKLTTEREENESRTWGSSFLLPHHYHTTTRGRQEKRLGCPLGSERPTGPDRALRQGQRAADFGNGAERHGPSALSRPIRAGCSDHGRSTRGVCRGREGLPARPKRCGRDAGVAAR